MRMQKLTGYVCVAAIAAGSVVVAQGGRGQGGRGGAPRVEIKEGEECPPGMVEVRANSCQAPINPPPSIVDYRPRSTVVAKATHVPRAKFPVADVHTHRTSRLEGIAERVKERDALNLRVLVDLSGGNAAEVKQKVDALQGTPYKDRFRVFANVDWEGAGDAGWEQKVLADLRQAVKNGAIGLKVYKELGLRHKKADGTRLAIDDPALDPVWALAGELNIPVIIHTAEPQEFF